jgi:uncharacterized protein (DUF1015 family)
VIGPGTLEQLRAASPYNVVRLILPALEPGAVAPGEVAAQRLRDWLSDGVLTVDDEPALYVYEQRGPGWVQRGLIGLVRVGAAGILPHEGVMPGPVAGRRELMAATRSNLEPILLVYNGGTGAGGHGGPAGPVDSDAGGSGRADSAAGDSTTVGSTAGNSTTGSSTTGGSTGGGSTGGGSTGGGSTGGGSTGGGSTGGASTAGASTTGASAASRLVDLTADSRPPLAEAATGDGVTHRLWAITDPAEHAAVAADLAGRTALIADGHHRYAAYGQLRARMRGDGAGAGPWDFGLAFLVDSDAYPLRLGAIHRVLPRLALNEAARLASGAFTVTELTPTGPTPTAPAEVAGALSALAEAGKCGPAFLLAGRDGYWLLTNPNPDEQAAAMPPGSSARWQALDASIMQELLLARLWSIKDNERDVLISHDAAEAVQLAVETGGTAVLCNPMDLPAVMELAAHGERVPRKSTSFGPKPRTGLVLRTFDS